MRVLAATASVASGLLSLIKVAISFNIGLSSNHQTSGMEQDEPSAW